MFKPTPNPPEADQAPPRTKSKAKKHDEATKRVLDHYLLPKPEKSEDASQPGQLFTVAKNADNESLLANLSETLAAADAMVSNLAFDLEGQRRHIHFRAKKNGPAFPRRPVFLPLNQLKTPAKPPLCTSQE